MNGTTITTASVLALSLMMSALGPVSAGHVTKNEIEDCQALIPAVDTDIEGAASLTIRVMTNLKRKTKCIDDKLETAIRKFDFDESAKAKHSDGMQKINQALECAIAFEDRVIDLDTNDKITEGDADQILGGDDGGGAVLTDGGIDAVIDCLESDLGAVLP
jgi:hypothetical protein